MNVTHIDVLAQTLDELKETCEQHDSLPRLDTYINTDT